MAYLITDDFVSTLKTPCHLLSLPAELRELIWTFAYNLQTIETTIQRFSFGSIVAIPNAILPDEHFQRRPPQLGLPIWLTTCRQMLNQGMNVLSREYVFTSTLFPFQGMRVVETLEDDVFN